MFSESTNTEVDLQTAMIAGLESLEPPPPKNVTFYNSTINLGMTIHHTLSMEHYHHHKHPKLHTLLFITHEHPIKIPY